MPDKTHIYGLVCPLEDKIKYVGKSDDPRKRFKYHLRAYRDTPKDRWIKNLHSLGVEPRLVVLQTVASNQWRDVERWWMKSLRTRGSLLTNATPPVIAKTAIRKRRKQKTKTRTEARMPVVVYIGKRLKQARTRKLLTQEELAKVSGISVATIIRIENNQVEPQSRTLRKLAAALDVPPADLLED